MVRAEGGSRRAGGSRPGEGGGRRIINPLSRRSPRAKRASNSTTRLAAGAQQKACAEARAVGSNEAASYFRG